MKITYPKKGRMKCRKIPNCLFFNRFIFDTIKLCTAFKYPPILKIRYKMLKPVMKKAKDYSGMEILSVEKQDKKISIFL